jgi:hypothetical protein
MLNVVIILSIAASLYAFDMLNFVILSVVMLNIFMMSVVHFYCYAECHYYTEHRHQIS